MNPPPANQSIPRFIRFGLFLVLLGAPLGAIIGRLYSRVSAFAGMPKAYCEASGVLLFLALALWIARTGTRETDADRSEEGRVLSEGSIHLTRMGVALYLCAAGIVIVPLVGYDSTFALGYILATIALGAPVIVVLRDMGRQHVRSVRRVLRRCQRCGYDLRGSLPVCPECRDPNTWRPDPQTPETLSLSETAAVYTETPEAAAREDIFDVSAAANPPTERLTPAHLDVRRQRRLALWLLMGSIAFAIGATIVYQRLFAGRVVWTKYFHPINLPIGAWGIVLVYSYRLFRLHRWRSIDPDAHASMWPWSLPALLLFDASERCWRAYPWLVGAMGSASVILLLVLVPSGSPRVIAAATGVVLTIAAATVPPREWQHTRQRRRLFDRCERCAHALPDGSDVCPLCGRHNDWRARSRRSTLHR